jgi:hypothetical protein
MGRRVGHSVYAVVFCPSLMGDVRKAARSDLWLLFIHKGEEHLYNNSNRLVCLLHDVSRTVIYSRFLQMQRIRVILLTHYQMDTSLQGIDSALYYKAITTFDKKQQRDGAAKDKIIIL